MVEMGDRRPRLQRVAVPGEGLENDCLRYPRIDAGRDGKPGDDAVRVYPDFTFLRQPGLPAREADPASPAAGMPDRGARPRAGPSERNVVVEAVVVGGRLGRRLWRRTGRCLLLLLLRLALRTGRALAVIAAVGVAAPAAEQDA